MTPEHKPQNQTRHPAKFSDAVLRTIHPYIEPWMKILDPFAGTGKVHLLNGTTVGVELEPEWAAYHPDTIVGNALELPFDSSTFDAIVTSPCYGNRMADHHNARDDSRRNTYKAALGREPSGGSSAVMQWGPEYRCFHDAAWRRILPVLKPGGLFILNISDHIRNHRVQAVSQWHVTSLKYYGLHMEQMIPVDTQRNRQGENGGARVQNEWVFVMRKPEVPRAAV